MEGRQVKALCKQLFLKWAQLGLTPQRHTHLAGEKNCTIFADIALVWVSMLVKPKPYQMCLLTRLYVIVTLEEL